MAEATVTEETAYDVKIEDAGPARKRLTITIPAEEIDGKIDDSFSTLISEATLPGFRKGRAPRRLIERRFGASVRTEAKNQLVADAYSKAIEQHSIKVVGDPEADQLADLDIQVGRPLVFSVEVEVVPEFELPDLDGISLKKPVITITDEHIEEELKGQLFRFGQVGVVDGAVEAGDRLMGHALARKADGTTVADQEGVVVIVPTGDDDSTGHVLGIPIDDLAKLFDGRSIGDTVEIDAVGPENDERVDLRGENLKIDFTVREGQRITPATVDSVVENYGLATEGALREQIKSALEQRAVQEQAGAMREQVYEHLLGAIEFDLPEKLSSNQAGRLLDRARVEMLYRGMHPDAVEAKVAQMRAASEVEARRQLKLFFVLHKIADTLEVKVSEQEINGRIAMIAAQRGERPEQLRAQLAREGRLQQIAMHIREHKAADRVVEKAKVEEISAEAWNKLIAAKSGDTESASGRKKKTTTRKKTSKKTSKKTTKKS